MATPSLCAPHPTEFLWPGSEKPFKPDTRFHLLQLLHSLEAPQVS